MLGMRARGRAIRRVARRMRRVAYPLAPWRRRRRLVGLNRAVWRGLARGMRLARGVATLLIIGAVVYKLTNRDVDRIEQATGKRAEDLSQAELENAMEGLGIEPLDLEAPDEEAVRQAETRRLTDGG
jgi:hypothetical protein